jgi:hypothetical protein
MASALPISLLENIAALNESLEKYRYGFTGSNSQLKERKLINCISVKGKLQHGCQGKIRVYFMLPEIFARSSGS